MNNLVFSILCSNLNLINSKFVKYKDLNGVDIKIFCYDIYFFKYIVLTL